MITLGALRPRFRGRLMIPIRDHQGRVVAFTARQTELTPDGRSGARGQVRQFAGDADLHQGQPALQPGPRPHRRRRGQALRHGRGPARRAALLVGRAEDAPWRRRARRSPKASSPSCAATTRGRVLLRQRRRRARRRRCGCCRWRCRAGLEVRFLALGGRRQDRPRPALPRARARRPTTRCDAAPSARWPSPAGRSCPRPGRSLGRAEGSRAAQAVFESCWPRPRARSPASAFLAEAAAAPAACAVGAQQGCEPSRAAAADRQRPAGRRGRGAGSAPAGPPRAVHTPEHDLLLLCLHFESLGKPLSAALPHDWIDRASRPASPQPFPRRSSSMIPGPGRDHLERSAGNAMMRKRLSPPSFSTPRTSTIRSRSPGEGSANSAPGRSSPGFGK